MGRERTNEKSELYIDESGIPSFMVAAPEYDEEELDGSQGTTVMVGEEIVGEVEYFNGRPADELDEEFTDFLSYIWDKHGKRIILYAFIHDKSEKA